MQQVIQLILFCLMRSACCLRLNQSPDPDAEFTSSLSKAYVTFMDGESDFFLPGLQALSTSLVESKTTWPLLVVITQKPSANLMDKLQKTTKCIQQMGMKVHLIQMPTVKNPIKRHAARFDRVYDKLDIFAMPLDRLVYVDADAVVVQNIDELFDEKTPSLRAAPDCGYCRHTKRFNTGVLAIAPSNATYYDMLSKLTTMESYDGSDQGFLNTYYAKEWKSTPGTKLTTHFNTLKRLESKRNLFDMSKIRVIHNVGTKPWVKDDPDGKNYPKSHGFFHKMFAVYQQKCSAVSFSHNNAIYTDSERADIGAFMIKWKQNLA